MTEEIKTETTEETPETAKFITLFQSIMDDEEEIKDIRSGIKDAIDAFVEENNEKYSKKSVKAAYRYFKKLVKDKQTVLAEEAEMDVIKDLITI